MNILFHSNQFGGRGTETALYDMAHYNEVILNNISYVASPSNSDNITLDKFQLRFGERVIRYNTLSELFSICNKLEITHSYIIRSGEHNDFIIPNCKNFIHCVFNGSKPHGEYYYAVSEWLGKKYNIPYLPHIVSLPSVNHTYREFLNIPKNAIVIGRHGGYEQFSIPYVWEAMQKTLFNRNDIYFLLMNTKPVIQHERIIYLDPVYDNISKVAFLNTCDYGLTARLEGETFGLSIAEYLHQNKQVITNIIARDKNHISMLKMQGLYYENPDELFYIFNTLDKPKESVDVTSLISDFSPEKIMSRFNKILSDG